MVKKSIDAKVRPLANPALEKASLLGAARLYVSKESLIALTNGLENGKPCVVEKLEDQAQSPVRREASLWILPEKNLSPNVVMMTRAFQDATGFRIGDQVRISLLESMPDVDEVVVQDVSEEQQQAKDGRGARHAACWEFSLSLSMGGFLFLSVLCVCVCVCSSSLNKSVLCWLTELRNIERADLIFPGMVFEGVNINKLRRTFKVVSVNSHTNNVAKFSISSSTIRILAEGDDSAAADEAEAFTGGELAVTGVPGLASQISTINRFLKGFTRQFWVKDERESCAFVIHGGHGTGKTFILQKIADTRWGRPFWIKPADKLAAIRETFKQAHTLQPSVILIDGLEDLISKDRSNRDSVIDVIGEELDALSAEARARNALPQVIVIATCLDYMTDVPAKLQKRSRFRENIALPIPRASERLEILNFFDPPVHPADKRACLDSVAQKTHAYNGDDLANLVLNAKKILGNRLDEEGLDPCTAGEQFLSKDDMEQALRITRPTAMHDINLKPPTIHWQDVGGQESLKKVLNRMIKNTKVRRCPPAPLYYQAAVVISLPHTTTTSTNKPTIYRTPTPQADTSSATLQRASSSTGRRAAPKRSPRRPWPPSPGSTSSPSRAPSCSTCTWASRSAPSARCSSGRAPPPRPSSSSTKSTPSAASAARAPPRRRAAPAPPAPSTCSPRCSPRWTASRR